MKFFLSLIFLSFHLFTLSVNAQFSGKITYEFEYENPTSQNLESLLQDVKIDSILYYVSHKAYKSVCYADGKVYEEYVYDAASKRMLFSMGNRPYYLYLQTDLEKFTASEVLQIEPKDRIEILGNSAYKTINLYTGEISYFSDAIQIDYAEFNAHYFMQWNRILKETNGSIPLKSISQQNGVCIVKTATKIEEIPADEIDFSFNKSQEQVAAYNNLDEVIEFPELKGSGFWCYQAEVEKHSSKLIDGKDYQLTLRFVVHPYGKITHVEVEKSEYDYLNEAAKHIIQNCDLGFKAGKINGNAVSSEIFYPINF